MQLVSDLGSKSARLPITAATFTSGTTIPASDTTLITGGRMLLTQFGSDRQWNSLNFQVEDSGSSGVSYYIQDVSICPACAAPVYVDALASGWAFLSWNVQTIDWQSEVTRSSADTQRGRRSVQLQHNVSWGGLSLKKSEGFGPTGVILFSVYGLVPASSKVVYLQLKSATDNSMSSLVPIPVSSLSDAEQFSDVAMDLSMFDGFGKVWHEILFKVGKLSTGDELVYNVMDVAICGVCGQPLPPAPPA